MDERRLVRLDGPYNFRDLGGYRAAGGRTVRWRALFRSDDLVDATSADVDRLARLGLRTVIDFRDERETIIAPDRLPPTVVDRRLLTIEAGRLMVEFSGGEPTRDKVVAIMISVYRSLVADFQSNYREFFEIVSAPASAPLLFHCTAGKDRTGLAAALLLSALGVDRKTVMEDYMLSKECLRQKYRSGEDYDSVLEPLYSVRPEFLAASLDAIDGEYGGMEKFLTGRLGADLALLRKMYTE